MNQKLTAAQILAIALKTPRLQNPPVQRKKTK